MVSTRNSIAAKPSPEHEQAKATPVNKDRTRAARTAKYDEQGTPAKATGVGAKLKSKRAKRRSRVAARMKAESLTRKGAAKTETIQDEGKDDES